MTEELKQRRLVGSKIGIDRWREKARAAREMALPIVRRMIEQGASYRTIAAVLNAAGIPTVRNATWSAPQVMRIARP
jgi:DNA invertase Pin-like site-specific DNA recombinase